MEESRELIGGRVPGRDRNEEGRAENARPRDRYGRPLPYGLPNEMGDRREPEEVVASVDEALDQVVVLFAEQRFFEAHEFLEYIWKSDQVAAADRDYWKGVTQVAVGLAHTQRGNASGAVKLLERARRYMAPYPSPYGGVDRDRLAESVGHVIAQIEQRGARPDLDFPPFPRRREA